jgi:hypothetical protein
VTYLIQEILRAPSSNDSNLKRIALTYEWIFMPVVNPDGYEYSHTEVSWVCANAMNMPKANCCWYLFILLRFTRLRLSQNYILVGVGLACDLY